MIGLNWFLGAQVCFAFAALIFLIKVTEIAIVMNHPFLERALFTFLLFGIVGIIAVEAIRGIGKLPTPSPIGAGSGATTLIPQSGPVAAPEPNRGPAGDISKPPIRTKQNAGVGTPNASIGLAMPPALNSRPVEQPITEPPDLSFLLFSKNGEPRFSVLNSGSETGEQPKWTIAIADLSNGNYPKDYGDNTSQPLPIPTKKIDDFVKPHTSLGNFEIFNQPALVHIKTGDRLFGFLGITCANCPTETKIWLYWEVGVGGWHAPFSPVNPREKLFRQPNMSNSEVDELLSRIVPIEKRIAIGEGEAPGIDLTRP